MYRVVKKLYFGKQALVQWQRAQPIVFTRIRLARKKLENIQYKLAQQQNCEANIQDEKAARDPLQKQLLIEESLLKQKSRDMDLNLGKHEHQILLLSSPSKEKKKTLINSIEDAERKVYNQPDEIKEDFVDHFKKILAPQS